MCYLLIGSTMCDLTVGLSKTIYYNYILLNENLSYTSVFTNITSIIIFYNKITSKSKYGI